MNVTPSSNCFYCSFTNRLQIFTTTTTSYMYRGYCGVLAISTQSKEHCLLLFFTGNGSNMSYDAYEDMWDWYSTYTGQDFPEKVAADSIFIYVSPFLLLIGTIGNILSVIVLKKLSHKVRTVMCIHNFKLIKLTQNTNYQMQGTLCLMKNREEPLKKCNYHTN